MLDDGSTDARRDPRGSSLEGCASFGTTAAAGWIGKVHACHRLALEARGDLLLFVDADTRLLPGGAAPDRLAVRGLRGRRRDGRAEAAAGHVRRAARAPAPPPHLRGVASHAARMGDTRSAPPRRERPGSGDPARGARTHRRVRVHPSRGRGRHGALPTREEERAPSGVRRRARDRGDPHVSIVRRSVGGVLEEPLRGHRRASFGAAWARAPRTQFPSCSPTRLQSPQPRAPGALGACTRRGRRQHGAAHIAHAARTANPPKGSPSIRSPCWRSSRWRSTRIGGTSAARSSGAAAATFPTTPGVRREPRARSLVPALGAIALRRGLDGVSVSGVDAPGASARRRPVIFAANHVGWWDGLLVCALDEALGASPGSCRRAEPRATPVPPLDRGRSARSHVGSTGPARSDPGGRVLASAEGRALDLPAGRAAPAPPAPPRSGARHRARAEGPPVAVVPVAIQYVFFEQDHPSRSCISETGVRTAGGAGARARRRRSPGSIATCSEIAPASSRSSPRARRDRGRNGHAPARLVGSARGQTAPLGDAP